MTDLHIFTCSVYPDLTRVWYRVLSRTFGGSPPPTLIFDCGGGLQREWFPGADVQRVPNWEHGRKIDLALQKLGSADLVWVLDDDVFPLSRGLLRRGVEALESASRMAAYTFHYRDWWTLPAADGVHVPMGSYALLVRPEIIAKEGLSFRTKKTSDPTIRKGTGYWDTGDFLQKELLERGYSVGYSPDEDRQDIPTFFGTSGGFLTFSRRSLLTRRYVRRFNWRGSKKAVLSDSYSFQRGCSLTAVIGAFCSLVTDMPSFGDWFSQEELQGLAAGLPDELARREYRATADRVFAVRDRLVRPESGRRGIVFRPDQ